MGEHLKEKPPVVTISNYTNRSGSFFLHECRLMRGYPIHWHDFYELELVLSGRGVITINGKESELLPGAFYMLRPVDLHSIRSERPLRLISAKLIATQLPSYLQTLLSSAASVQMARVSGREFITVKNDFKRLLALLDSETHNTLCGHSLIMLLVSTLFCLAGKDSPGGAGDDADGIDTAMIFIQENFRSEICEEDAARVSGFSKNYFSRLFKEKTGSGFIEYVSALRTSHSCALLTGTNKPLREVAAASGFGSYSNYQRIFKSLYGVSPSSYRKQNGRPAPDIDK